MSNEVSRKTALITGASAGIGAAFARIFASEGFDLVLTARREERLKELAAELKTAHGAKALCITADLEDPAAPQALHDRIKGEAVNIDALVNNAGYGVPDKYQSAPWEKHARFIQIMVTAPSHLTHLFEADMTERGYGRIINVASLAGLLPGPSGHTLYAAAKSYLIKLSESLSLEHADDDVNVCAVCPGFTYSEFHDVVGNRGNVSKLPKFMWMDADTVAREGYEAVMAGRPVHVNGGVNRLLSGLTKLVPHSIGVGMMRRNSKWARSDD